MAVGNDTPGVPYSNPKQCGKWTVPAGEGGTQFYCGRVRHRADCRKWNGAELLVYGGAVLPCNGACVYHGDRTVYGRKRRGRRKILHEKAAPHHLPRRCGMECVFLPDFPAFAAAL